jgi:hypothetical protein
VTAAELEALQELWQAAPEPSEQTWADARARLFEAIGGAERVEPSLRRAPRRRRLRGRRLGLVLALLVIAFVFLAGVAVAFHLHVVLFGLADKAPPPVVKTFAELDVGAPPGMASGVVPNETRRVGIFDGHTLWVAPTANGGFCFVFSDDVGGCDSLGAMPLTVSARGIRESTRDRLRGIGGLSEVNGDVSSRWADAVEIRFQDGESIRPEITWVSSPIGVGFFLEPIPVEHRQPGHLVSEVVALDRDGFGSAGGRDPRSGNATGVDRHGCRSGRVA